MESSTHMGRVAHAWRTRWRAGPHPRYQMMLAGVLLVAVLITAPTRPADAGLLTYISDPYLISNANGIPVKSIAGETRGEPGFCVAEHCGLERTSLSFGMVGDDWETKDVEPYFGVVSARCADHWFVSAKVTYSEIAWNGTLWDAFVTGDYYVTTASEYDYFLYGCRTPFT